MAQFNEAFEESLRAGGASRQKSINSSTLRDVITNRSPDDYKKGAGQGKINSALRFFEAAGIADMTVGELADDPVAFVNAMTGDAYANLGKNQANEASKFISGIFQDAGHGKAWGSNTLKKELSPEKALELFPIESTQEKVKGYPDDFFTRTKKVVMELQAAGQKEAAAQFLLTMTGGYRSADLTDVLVQDIDFRTGVLFDVEVKDAATTTKKTGVFSAPQLDVLKDYLGGRTEGVLFANPDANAKIINAALKRNFPPDYLTKNTKARGTFTTGVTLYDYRHFNETFLSSMDVSDELRKVATLRSPSKVSERYAASGARRKDINRLHGGLLSLFAAGSNTSSPAQFLNDVLSVDGSQPLLSDRTRKLTATRELIEQVGYEDAISPSLYASLPEEGDVTGTRAVGIDPETTAALNQQTQSEAMKAALQADIDAGAMAEDAAAARAKALETRQDQDKQRKEAKLDDTKGFLMKNIDKFKPLATFVPLVGTAAGIAGIPQVREDISDTMQELFGMSPAYADAVGTVGAIGDFAIGEALIVAPSDAVAGSQALGSLDSTVSPESLETADMAPKLVGRDDFAGQPFSSMSQSDFQPVKIPSIPPTSSGMLEASNAKDKVNLATRAAEQGQETTMTGSFMNP
jgi:hypothetical protein